MTDLMRKHRRRLIAVLLVLAGVGLALFRLTSLSEIFRVRTAWTMVDFRSQVYYPAVAFLGGENPYAAERFLKLYPVNSVFPFYLPVALLMHLPLGLLSVRTASAVYFTLTLALTFLLAFASLAFNKIKVKITDVFLIGGLVLLSRSGHWNLLLGQPTLEVVLASYVAFYFARRSAIISGLGLVISMMKPTFGILIALLMLTQGHVGPILYCAVIAMLTNLPVLTVLVYREGGIVHFFEELMKNFHVWQQDTEVNPALSIISIDATAFVSHSIGKPINNTVQLIIFVLISGVASWTLGRTGKVADERFQSLSTGIVCLAVLLSVHHQAYDLLLLTLPFVGLVYHKFPNEFYSSYRYGLSMGLLTILAVNYASTHLILPFVQPASGLWSVLVSINSATLLTLFCIWVHAAHTMRLGLCNSIHPSIGSSVAHG